MSNMKDNNEEQYLDDLKVGDLSVQPGVVEVGNTYPIYGMITEFIDETPGRTIVLVNSNIELTMTIDQEKIDLLKSRFFEPGIFVTLVNETGDVIKGDCSTVIFGKKQSDQVH